MGQIGISTVLGRMTIEQPPAEMHLEQPRRSEHEDDPGEADNRPDGSVGGVDIKHIFKNQRAAERGRQAALEGTARRAAEATTDEIEDGGRPLRTRGTEQPAS